MKVNRSQQAELTKEGNALKRKFQELKADEDSLVKKRQARKEQEKKAKSTPVEATPSSSSLDALRERKLELERMWLQKEVARLEAQLAGVLISY